MVVEINTYGKIKMINEWFPLENIIKIEYKLEIKIIFGLNAHLPQMVGKGFGKVT